MRQDCSRVRAPVVCVCVWRGDVPGLDAVLDEAVNGEEGDIPDDVAPEQAVESHVHPGDPMVPIKVLGAPEISKRRIHNSTKRTRHAASIFVVTGLTLRVPGDTGYSRRASGSHGAEKHLETGRNPHTHTPNPHHAHSNMHQSTPIHTTHPRAEQGEYPSALSWLATWRWVLNISNGQ